MAKATCPFHETALVKGRCSIDDCAINVHAAQQRVEPHPETEAMIARPRVPMGQRGNPPPAIDDEPTPELPA